MRLKLPTLSLLLSGAAIIASMALASCSTDQIEIPKDELFTREFIKQFGVPDPDHDWNQSHRATVTVTTAKPTQIKIYADVKGSRYLFGTFLGVNGSQQLGVDIPKGVDKLIVRANGISHTVSPGASLNLASRAAETTPEVTVELGSRANWKSFSAEEILSYQEYLPEEKTNIDHVTDNFTFIPIHDFIIYPVYYNTGNTPEIGIYYRPDGTTDPEDFVKTPIYSVKGNTVAEGSSDGASGSTGLSAQILQKCMDINEWVPVDRKEDFAAMTDELWSNYRVDNAPATNNMYEYLWWEYAKAGEWLNKVDEETKNSIISTYSGTYPFSSSDDMSEEYPIVHQLTWEVPGWNNESYDKDAQAWRSKGVIVHITPGQQYGFYMVDRAGYHFYSETEFNETLNTAALEKRDDMTDEAFESLIEKNAGKPAPHFGIYETTGAGGVPRYVVGAEDWYSGGAYDLNDAVFFVENITPDEVWPPFQTEDIDVPAYEWVVAAEDLGNTEDFDFNDVVFGVGNFKLSEDGLTATVDIRALAAGGTLPVYLYHDGNPVGGEFHSWFGASSNQVINAGSKTEKRGKTVTITVDKDFTMTCCQTVTGEPSNMGGFTIRVEGTTGGTQTTITAPNLDTNALNYAPQMICVPTHWQWPTERTHINSSYPTFKEWVTNQENCTDWHETCSGSVTKRTDIPVNKTKPTDGAWGYNPGTNPGGSTTDPSNPGGDTTDYGTVLSQYDDEKDTQNVFRKYNLSAISSQLSAATKVTFHVEKSTATYFSCGNNNYGQDYFVAWGGDETKDFTLEGEKLETLKNKTDIIVSFLQISSMDDFNPSVSIKIE